MLTRLAAAAAFVAFVVLGIVHQSSGGGDVLVTFWVLSFVLAALLAIWSDLAPEQRPTLGALWEHVPGPSKHPDDYR